jgi:hypothetical protein
MMKPYYSDYVRHALRFYTRNLSQPRFNNDADKNNWFSCKSVMDKYSDSDQAMFVEIYGGYDTLADNVYETAKKYELNQGILWDKMKEFERKIAKRRGLL